MRFMKLRTIFTKKEHKRTEGRECKQCPIGYLSKEQVTVLKESILSPCLGVSTLSGS